MSKGGRTLYKGKLPWRFFITFSDFLSNNLHSVMLVKYFQFNGF